MGFLEFRIGSGRAGAKTGKVLVDDELEPHLKRRLARSNAQLQMNGKYVGARLGLGPATKKFVPLHHMVWERVNGHLGKGKMVDHVNQNLLDNRIENLRIVDASERQANSPKHRDNTTGFKGVSKDKNGRFTASVGKNKRNHHLGVYDTTYAAAHAVNHGYNLLFPKVPIPNRLAADDLTSYQRREIEREVERLLNPNRLAGRRT